MMTVMSSPGSYEEVAAAYEATSVKCEQQRAEIERLRAALHVATRSLPTHDLPPHDARIHTPELIASLQKRAMKLGDDD